MEVSRLTDLPLVSPSISVDQCGILSWTATNSGQQCCPICQGKPARGAHNRLITSPPVAVFPHPLASDLSFSRYWNYLRKHTFVLESMLICLKEFSLKRSVDSDILPALHHHNQSNDQISDIHENKVKPVVRTPTGSMQSYSGVSAGPKIGARINRPSGGSSKTKLAKLQPARTVSTAANMKLEGQKPMSPLPSQKPSNASTKVSSVSGGLKKCLSISPQAHNETDNDVPNSGLDAEKAGSPGMLDREMNLEKQGNFNKKDIKIAPIKGDTHGNAENIKPSKVGEDAVSSLKHLRTKLRVIYKSNEKENAHFEDQVNGLTKNEVIGNSVTQVDFSHLDFHAPELSCSKEFFVLSQKEGSPSDISGPTSISPCPVTSEITASTRTPFAVKNSFCNSEGDFSTGLSIGAVEKISSSLPSLKSAQTENS
ncbi:hypothetical protein LOK49_LG13G02807 [Camellia lanceoleosa]|uniref:Uncharacterized protein n=1 Tax=Camellia lanceoleosa TaxID=1840588 RepID=A0ACC0FG85_9ERIC|nr:hypothetical protein LOK49_LG13G02807 [Camellia lanceoleosa]